MPRDLKADQLMLREVLRLAQAHDLGNAGAIARNALASGFEHPLLLNVQATCLELEGRFTEALPLLERAVALAPDEIPGRNALALCLNRLGRPAEALQHIDQLLKRHPELGFVHANRGDALIAQGYLSSGRASHLQALELEPDNVGSLAALASIATHRGNHEEARSWAEKALAIVPHFADAVLVLAAADLESGELDRAESRLRKLLADPGVGAPGKARANGLLGDVLDAKGKYMEAFVAYTERNEAMKRIHNRFAKNTRLVTYASQLVATIGNTTAQYRTPHSSGSGADVAGHVFLLGFPRSGTTLLEVVLEGHPRVVSLDEYDLLIDAVGCFMGNACDLRGLERASEDELQALRQTYWKRVREAGVEVSAKVFVDKYPMNTLKLPLIARLFPGAKVLFACRDPREVAFACFRRRFRMNPATYELLTLESVAALYDKTMKLAELMRPAFGADWHVVRYESLIADFDSKMRAICDFLGLEWMAGMDDFASRARQRERSTPSTAQLTRGLDRSATVHWKHYREALEPILPILGKWVERFEYPAV